MGEPRPLAEVAAPHPGQEYRWEAAAHEHRAALAGFVESAERLDSLVWSRPRAPEKWSPAQIAEHLALAYEVMRREIAGEGPPALRVGPWQERILRWFLLPHVLYHHHLPLRSRAPREVRPAEIPLRSQRESLDRLLDLGQSFELELHSAWRAGGGHLTNPYFGKVPPIRALRFCAVHVEHHRRQLPRESGGEARS